MIPKDIPLSLIIENRENILFEENFYNMSIYQSTGGIFS